MEEHRDMENGSAEILLHLLAEAEFRQALARSAKEQVHPTGVTARNGARSADWGQLAGAAAVAAGLGGELPFGEVTRLVASALTTVDAIGYGPAAAVAGDLDAALAARGLAPESSGPGFHGPGWPLLTPGPSPQQAPDKGVVAGSRVVPLAAVVPVRLAGQQAGLDLLACVLAGEGALFIGYGPVPPPGDPGLLHLNAVDDRGRRYRLAFQRLSPRAALWEGRLIPRLPPGAALQWLEITTPAGETPVRVDLDAQAPRSGAQIEPVPVRSTGERLVEAAAADLLAAALMPIPEPGAVAAVAAEAVGIGSVITALLALGLLPADSPDLRRLAALGDRLGIGFPVPATGLATLATSLPEAWQSILNGRSHRAGLAAITRIAAALPELDAARITLTALESTPDRALLHLHTAGWDPPSFGLRAFSGAGDPPLSWWARDSAGRWHAASGGRWQRLGDKEWSGLLQLRPPLHPSATSLELIVTGTTKRLHVELPLG
jgi:hypothetical protein